MKKFIKLFILVCIFLFIFCGCDGRIESLNSDNELILGSWQMDTSVYGEGIDLFRNLDGVITEITFYSDGTCTVDGVNGRSENGHWSFVDGKLKVLGDYGGDFWYYENFISSYDLNSDTLLIYDYGYEETYTYIRAN